MAKLSRMKKNQDLREQLEEQRETQAQVNIQETAESTSESEVVVQPKSEAMSDLMDEVKAYNIEQGQAVVDDTQINILKQLDGTQVKHRNQHFIPMEDQEEALGRTMNITIGRTSTNPFAKREEKEEVKEEPIVEAPQTNIVLGSDDMEQEAPAVEPVDDQPDYEAIERERKRKARQAKKAQRTAEKKARAARREMPSDRVKQQQPKQVPNTSAQRTGKILNIVLIVLIILLVISIGFVVYTVRSMGI